MTRAGGKAETVSGLESLAENSGAHADQIGPRKYRPLIVGTHAHGQNMHTTIIVFFRAYVNKKLCHFLKIAALFRRFGTNWRNSHKAPHIYAGNGTRKADKLVRT